MITLKYRRLSWYGVALIPGAAEPGERGRETKVPKRGAEKELARRAQADAIKKRGARQL